MGKPNEQLTIAEVCAELKISRRTFYQWKAKGCAPQFRKLPNASPRISRKALDDWLESLEDAA